MASAMISTTPPSTMKRPAPGSSIVSSPTSCSEVTTMATQHVKRQRTQKVSPLSTLRSIFGDAGLASNVPSRSFTKPSEEEIAAYDLDAVRAIRGGELLKLKQLHSQGKNLNASNQFGESLLHMACRRGNIGIVSFMLREAKVRVDIRDDFGRNPVHDACWTSSPNFEVMDELLEFVDPYMLLSEDVRGSAPFDYVRKEHWNAWVKYLMERKDKLEERIHQAQQVSKKTSSST